MALLRGLPGSHCHLHRVLIAPCSGNTPNSWRPRPPQRANHPLAKDSGAVWPVEMVSRLIHFKGVPKLHVNSFHPRTIKGGRKLLTCCVYDYVALHYRFVAKKRRALSSSRRESFISCSTCMVSFTSPRIDCYEKRPSFSTLRIISACPRSGGAGTATSGMTKGLYSKYSIKSIALGAILCGIWCLMKSQAPVPKNRDKCQHDMNLLPEELTTINDTQSLSPSNRYIAKEHSIDNSITVFERPNGKMV